MYNYIYIYTVRIFTIRLQLSIGCLNHGQQRKTWYFNYQRPIKHIGNEFHWKVLASQSGDSRYLWLKLLGTLNLW